MSAKVSKVARSTKEAKEILNAAETLDLEVKNAWFNGAWESDEGKPIFLSGGTYEIKKIGYKYFTVEITGPDGKENCKVEPYKSATRDKGTIRFELV